MHDLAEQLAERADEIRSVIGQVSGVRSYYVVKLDDATVSITICDDEEGTAESSGVAAEWIRENLPDLAASPLLVSSGAVTLNA